MIPVSRVEGSSITTIEGLAKNGKLHPVQQAFLEEGAIQCGYCTSGMIMRAVSLLAENPRPSEKEIKKAMNRNICRCNGYAKILAAIKKASELIGKEKKRAKGKARSLC